MPSASKRAARLVSGARATRTGEAVVAAFADAVARALDAATTAGDHDNLNDHAAAAQAGAQAQASRVASVWASLFTLDATAALIAGDNVQWLESGREALIEVAQAHRVQHPLVWLQTTTVTSSRASAAPVVPTAFGTALQAWPCDEAAAAALRASLAERTPLANMDAQVSALMQQMEPPPQLRGDGTVHTVPSSTVRAWLWQGHLTYLGLPRERGRVGLSPELASAVSWWYGRWTALWTLLAGAAWVLAATAGGESDAEAAALRLSRGSRAAGVAYRDTSAAGSDTVLVMRYYGGCALGAVCFSLAASAAVRWWLATDAEAMPLHAIEIEADDGTPARRAMLARVVGSIPGCIMLVVWGAIWTMTTPVASALAGLVMLLAAGWWGATIADGMAEVAACSAVTDACCKAPASADRGSRLDPHQRSLQWHDRDMIEWCHQHIVHAASGAAQGPQHLWHDLPRVAFTHAGAPIDGHAALRYLRQSVAAAHTSPLRGSLLGLPLGVRMLTTIVLAGNPALHRAICASNGATVGAATIAAPPASRRHGAGGGHVGRDGSAFDTHEQNWVRDRAENGCGLYWPSVWAVLQRQPLIAQEARFTRLMLAVALSLCGAGGCVVSLAAAAAEGAIYSDASQNGRVAVNATTMGLEMMVASEQGGTYSWGYALQCCGSTVFVWVLLRSLFHTTAHPWFIAGLRPLRSLAYEYGVRRVLGGAINGVASMCAGGALLAAAATAAADAVSLTSFVAAGGVLVAVGVWWAWQAIVLVLPGIGWSSALLYSTGSKGVAVQEAGSLAHDGHSAGGSRLLGAAAGSGAAALAAESVDVEMSAGTHGGDDGGSGTIRDAAFAKRAASVVQGTCGHPIVCDEAANDAAGSTATAYELVDREAGTGFRQGRLYCRAAMRDAMIGIPSALPTSDARVFGWLGSLAPLFALTVVAAFVTLLSPTGATDGAGVQSLVGMISAVVLLVAGSWFVLSGFFWLTGMMPMCEWCYSRGGLYRALCGKPETVAGYAGGRATWW